MLLIHLTRVEGCGKKPRVSEAPALTAYCAASIDIALSATMVKLREQLRMTLTWDRGKELSADNQIALESGTRVHLVDQQSPYQQHANENENENEHGLVRQCFPKSTDLSDWSAEDLGAVTFEFNNRPRKILR